MSTDRIADLLTRVRNAQRAGHPTVTVPGSRAKERVLSVLLEEGYIDRFEPVPSVCGKKQSLKVFLRYGLDGRPAIRELKRLSTPGKRIFVPSSDIPKNRGGLGIVVVSTSKGMLSDRQARKDSVGGELICSVF